MDCKGSYKAFDPGIIETYPVATRTNKVKVADLLFPDRALSVSPDVPADVLTQIRAVARTILDQRRLGHPVIFFAGAHLIKNGLGPLLVDLVKRDVVTLVAGNGATAIHDFELALLGETSEYVPDALSTGQFGMAYEFCYINHALQHGNRLCLGYGESLGHMICDPEFAQRALAGTDAQSNAPSFEHPEVSLLATALQYSIPFTVHAGIGVDVIDQHSSFDGQAKGGCSGRDFLIYVNEVCKLASGGVVLNIGSAVQGPEVLLKAVSMAANCGAAPNGLVTADFDIRPYSSAQMTDEEATGYYFRDQKSVVTRIPESFSGRGYYICGNQKNTVPLLYQAIVNPQ
jgi:hypothetical protein